MNSTLTDDGAVKQVYSALYEIYEKKLNLQHNFLQLTSSLCQLRGPWAEHIADSCSRAVLLNSRDSVGYLTGV